eukprot:jgi/Botrbrau1/19350/Bobra.0073s0075.1
MPSKERVVGFHGSQCGFCTPGMVVACHAALHKAAGKGQPLTPDYLEKAVDGNLCRCTGYRPILDAAKSFTGDIEDLGLNAFTGGSLPGDFESAAAAPEFPQDLKDYVTAKWKAEEVVVAEGRQKWLTPRSLPQLWTVLEEVRASGSPFRVVAGNTAAGVYKNWPQEDTIISLLHVSELRAVSSDQSGVTVGGGVVLGELIEVLKAAESNSRWKPKIAHLERIAGTLVRSAATVGGNLAAARLLGLESDPVLLLMAAGASVTVSNKTSSRTLSVEDVLDASIPLELGVGELVTKIFIPAPGPHDVFWSDRIAARYSNAVSLINAAVWLRKAADGSVEDLHVVYGFPTGAGWAIKRAATVEAAVKGKKLDVPSLVAALEGLPQDVPVGGPDAAYLKQAAEGLLLKAFAPLVPQGGSEEVRQLLEAKQWGPPPLVKGSQDFGPAPEENAPVGKPITKHTAHLQASGEAVFTSDLELPKDGLAAAPVLSTEALAKIVSIDTSEALALPGVFAWVDRSNIPEGGKNVDVACRDTIFADGIVEYPGQRIGLVLAETQTLAERAAKLVKVTYAPVEGRKPILTLKEAIEANSFYNTVDLMEDNFVRKYGDPEGALAASKNVIKGLEYATPSQFHLYMEPQAAVAIPDEGGSMLVHSSTQCVDMVHGAVADVLGLPFNKVQAKVRRVGGGFGGKSSRSMPIAAAAAVAANAVKRPVRLVLNRNDDFRMIGGRSEMSATYDIGFDDDGVITAVIAHAYVQAGAFHEISEFIPLLYLMSADQNYRLPNSYWEAKLAKTNLPPRTIMRGPGTMQAVFFIENVIEAVAAKLGLDPVLVRERNLYTHTLLTKDRKPCAGVLPDNVRAAEVPSDVLPPDDAPPEDGYTPGEVTDHAIDTSFGIKIPLDQYSVQTLWKELKEKSQYEQRYGEIKQYNQEHKWQKRGISMTSARFIMSVDAKPAAVSILWDGTVQVMSPGHDMGQGIATKVKQAAAYALGQALPAAQRPFPIDKIQLADITTAALPNAGPSWGSTTSEAASKAVMLACEQLVETLKPAFAQLGEGATWEAAVRSLHPALGFSASKVPLTAYAFYDGSQQHDKAKPEDALVYNGYGAAVTEVEVDVLTGEVRTLRVDVALDAGHSLNPAIDIGQVEGGYVQGLGLMLTEDVKVDPETGKLVADSTWTYKVPSVETIPRQINVYLLKNHPHPRGIMSSKATGEPPLLLAISALCALQMAINAAREDLAGVASVEGTPAPLIRAPALPSRVKEAIGAISLAPLLKASAAA